MYEDKKKKIKREKKEARQKKGGTKKCLPSGYEPSQSFHPRCLCVMDGAVGVTPWRPCSWDSNPGSQCTNVVRVAASPLHHGGNQSKDKFLESFQLYKLVILYPN